MASTTSGRPRPLPPRRRPAEEQPEAGQTTVEPYRLTPKLARRVALLSALVVIGFAALFMRLWALQVLSGSQYAARAAANQVRTVRVQAPRGTIVDQHGNVLVANEPVTSVELSPSGLPKDYATRVAELRALAQVTGVSVRRLTNLILERRKFGDMLDPIVVRTRATGPMLTYLEERSAQFPGLTLARTYVRRYPHGSLAAQLLGYDGQISQPELKALGKDGYAPGDVIGQSGAEFAFNAYLRGTPGLARVRVDSLGRPRSPRLLTTPPQQGQTVRLTIDTGLQVAAQNALAGRDPGRAHQRPVRGRRRRNRRAQPAERLDPRARFGTLVQPVGLVGADHDEGAERPGPRHPTVRPGQELPGARPRARRDVSAGLGVQAAHRHRGARGGPDQAVLLLPVHGHVHRSGGPLAPRLPQLGPERERADGSADCARPVV